uniref:Pentatricopeptide repeat-containing protein n=1 Tax=Arundo donax TaxID=35708 RepID=A0A0A8Z8R1_ARUDO
MGEAMDIVLRRMPELGCSPTIVTYGTVLKGLCANKRSQEALKLLQMMVDDGGSCALNLVSYNTVIDGLFK